MTALGTGRQGGRLHHASQAFTQASGFHQVHLRFPAQAPESRARAASGSQGCDCVLFSLLEDKPGSLRLEREADPVLGCLPQAKLLQEWFSGQGQLHPHHLGQGMELACLVLGRAGRSCQDLAGLSLFF